MKRSFSFLAAVAMVAAASVSASAFNVGNIVVKRGIVDTVYKAKHQVVGLADPGAEFTVNGNKVKAYKTGTWGIELQLKEGENLIKVADGKTGSATFKVFYSTTPKAVSQQEKEAAAARAAAEAEKAKFYPTSLKVVTKQYSYLNYGAGTDRLGGAKINFLPEGIEMYADAENENLYRVKLSQNRYAYIPKSQVEIKGKYSPYSDFMQDNVVLSGSSSVYNAGEYDRVSIGVGGKKPYIVKEYTDPHKIVVDLYGVQCNSNWLTHKSGLKSVDHIDVESIDSDITRYTIYLKTKSSWGFSMDYSGNNLNIDIKHVPSQLYLKNLTIGIDAGHGGPQSNGAVGLSGLKEKDMTLDMAHTLKSILEKQGAKVVLSRDSDVGMTIRERQDKFIENKMHYYIDADKNFDFEIRIPSFAKNLKVNGENKEAKNLEFKINPGKTEIVIEFEATPYLKNRPNNLYVLQMGSLLFSVPIEYEKVMKEYVKKGVERKFPYCDYQFIPKSSWNYGFSDCSFEIDFNGIGDIPFSQKNPPVAIKANMQQIDWGLKFPYKSVARKTPKSTKPISEVQKIELIPYGCSKLRMTEMPILKAK